MSSSRSSVPVSILPSNRTSPKEKISVVFSIDDYLLSHQDELNIGSFNMDLQQIAMNDPFRAQSILEQLEEDARWESVGIRPNSATYHCVIEGWCNYQGNRQQTTVIQANVLSPMDSENDIRQNTIINPAMAAEQILDRMELATDNNLSPNPLSYLEVCEKWATIRPVSVANMKRAQAILDRYIDRMMTHYDQQQHRGNKNNEDKASGLDADRYHYHSTTKIRKNQTVSHPMYTPGNLSRMYGIVVEGWCRLIERVPEALDRIEQLLQEIESGGQRRKRGYTTDNKKEDNLGIRPNVMLYTSVITALSRTTKLSDMARRADDLLQRMKDHAVQPDLVAYTAVLSCWSKATSRVERNMASKRATDLLDEVENSYLQRRLAKPSPITYGTAIMAIARSFDRQASSIAESILRRMYDQTETRAIAIQPTTSCWNAVIYAFGTSRKAQEAEALLLEMIHRSRQDGEKAVRPNIKTWGGVIRAYAESGRRDAGEQAHRILERLEEEYRSGRNDGSGDDEDSVVKPNYVCYSTVLQAWARGKAPPNVALQKINSILHKMETEFEQTGDDDIRPNSITYTIAMDAYCRHDPTNCGTMSQKLVDRMVKLYGKGVGFERPSLVVMNTLINAWSRSRHPQATENAETIFRWMESQHASGDNSMKPNEVTLCNVLNAYANNASNGGAARAQQIMDYIESTPSDERVVLSVQPFNVLIKAWGRSGTLESVDMAERVLCRLERRYKNGEITFKPDIATYSSVINSAAYFTGTNDGKDDALEVALRTYQRIKASDEVANNVVFGTLFKAIGKLTAVGSRRDALLHDLFIECCQEGHVDSFVLSQFRFCSSMAQYRTLVLEQCGLDDDQGSSMNRVLRSIPTSWSRNVS